MAAYNVALSMYAALEGPFAAMYTAASGSSSSTTTTTTPGKAAKRSAKGKGPLAPKRARVVKTATPEGTKRETKTDRTYLTMDYTGVPTLPDQNYELNEDHVRSAKELKGNKSLHGWWTYETSAAWFQCVCGTHTARLGDMERHVAQQHYGTGKVKCPKCKAPMTNASYLANTHLPNVHGKKTPHACTVCPNTFADPSAAKKCAKSHNTPLTTETAEFSASEDHTSPTRVNEDATLFPVAAYLAGSVDAPLTSSNDASPYATSFPLQQESFGMQNTTVSLQYTVNNDGTTQTGLSAPQAPMAATGLGDGYFGMPAQRVDVSTETFGGWHPAPHTSSYAFDTGVNPQDLTLGDATTLPSNGQFYNFSGVTPDTIQGASNEEEEFSPSFFELGEDTGLPSDWQPDNFDDTPAAFAPAVSSNETYIDPELLGSEIPQQTPLVGFNFSTGYQPQDSLQSFVPSQTLDPAPAGLGFAEQVAAMQQQQQHVQAAAEPLYNPLYDLGYTDEDDVTDEFTRAILATGSDAMSTPVW